MTDEVVDSGDVPAQITDPPTKEVIAEDAPKPAAPPEGPAKRPRGRPKKESPAEPPERRPRGRPRKLQVVAEPIEAPQAAVAPAPPAPTPKRAPRKPRAPPQQRNSAPGPQQEEYAEPDGEEDVGAATLQAIFRHLRGLEAEKKALRAEGFSRLISAWS